MSKLEGLYQELILDHSKKPRNFHSMADADRHADGYNPLCGDRFTVYLKLKDDRIIDISFRVRVRHFHRLRFHLNGDFEGEDPRPGAGALRYLSRSGHGKTHAEGETPALGKLAAFSGVCEFPVRVKCATLVWHTLRTALNGDEKVATTE